MSNSTPSLSSTSAATRWFYADSNNEAVGPLPLPQLMHLAAAGMISDETLVIEDGGEHWKPYSAIASTMRATTPPPLPSPVIPSPLPPSLRVPSKPGGLLVPLAFVALFGILAFCAILAIAVRSTTHPVASPRSASLPEPPVENTSRRNTDVEANSDEARTRKAIADRQVTVAKDRATIEKIVAESFGDQLKNVEVARIGSGPSEGLYNVEIRFDIRKGWSAQSQKRDAERQMRDAYQRLFTPGSQVWEVFISAGGNLIDSFGQERVEVVYKTSMTKIVAEKINWNNKALLDFTKIWTTKTLHPALEKK